MGKKLYNENLKRMYLDSGKYKNSTLNNILNVFHKAYNTEIIYDKDISNFDQEEYNNFLLSLKAKSLDTLTSRNSIISKYIEFAYKEGYVPSPINIAELFDRKTLRRYVSKIALENKYINKEQLDKIVKKCANVSDALLFLLLFEGIKGESYSELINLKASDVNFNTKRVSLRDVNGNIHRSVVVSEKVLVYIGLALQETFYLSKNGEPVTTRRTNCYIADTSYVFRPAGKKKVNKVDTQFVMRRLKNIAKAYKNPFLTATHIWVSGMIEYAKQYKEKEFKRELTMHDYEHICEVFGNNKNNWHKVKTNIEKFI